MLSLIAISCLIAALIILVMLAIIDLRTWLLPNEYVFGLFVTGLCFHYAMSPSSFPIENIVGGVCIGAGLLYAIRFAAEKFYKPDALGLGDVKLMGAAGVWLGPHHILLALIIGGIAGILHGLTLAVLRKDFNLSALQLPAGPGFIVGIITAALYAFRNLPAIILP